MDGRPAKRPRCVASTQIEDSSGYFQDAKWSPDGTCVLTNNGSNVLQTYVIPPNLLESGDEPKLLEPYTTHASPESVYAWTPYPAFSLSDTSTTLVLSSPLDHPIRLTNVLNPGRLDSDTEYSLLPGYNPVVATYPFVEPKTEKWVTPYSLLFPPTASRAPGSSFLAGGHSLLAIFDTNRPGQEPIRRVKTIPSLRKKIKGGGVGIKGIVSALACSDASTGHGLVAAGTWTRNIGLYTADSSLDQFAVWSLREDAWASPTSDTDPTTGAKVNIDGSGIDKLGWSPCGTYLYVFERRSDGALVYDVRVLGKKLGTMVGRGARSNQRLGACVIAGAVSDDFLDGWNAEMLNISTKQEEEGMLAEKGSDHDVYATSTTGSLNIYRNPHLKEGMISPNGTIRELHGDAIGGLSMHPSCGVLATASGQRHSRWEEDEENDSAEDNGSSEDYPVRMLEQSLKIWTSQP